MASLATAQPMRCLLWRHASKKEKGDQTTLAVTLMLRVLGYIVSEPRGENARYDLIIDDGNELKRVQCKTGRLRNGAVHFATCSSYGHHRNPATARRDYVGQVDLFAVYCYVTSTVYLIPTDNLPNRNACALRVDPPRNNQRDRVRFASDYEAGRIAITAGLRATSGGSAPCA
jgi:hypothetical protein